MKKILLAKVLFFVIIFSLIFGPSAFSAPSLGGIWKGTVLKVSTTACSSLPVTLTLTQCLQGATPSNLVRGTLTVGSVSIPVVGRFSPSSNGIEINGGTSTSTTSTDVMMVGVYEPGGPTYFEISDFDLTVTNHTTGTVSNALYDVPLQLVKH